MLHVAVAVVVVGCMVVSVQQVGLDKTLGPLELLRLPRHLEYLVDRLR